MRSHESRKVEGAKLSAPTNIIMNNRYVNDFIDLLRARSSRSRFYLL